MRYLIALLFFSFFNNINAQNGFIQAYDFDEVGSAFHNILLVEDDTLILCGTIQNQETTQWGLHFVKLDTLGNILDSKMHFDSLGDSYVFEQNYDIIKTTDGGYALVGQLFNRNYGFLIKLDVNGDLDFFKEYPDETVLNDQHQNIVEFEHGYISMGVKQQTDDAKWDAYVMRLDTNGEKIWEINYGEYGAWDYYNSIIKNNENEFLMIGSYGIGSLEESNFHQRWSVPSAFKIDSLSNITWEWEGELNYYVDNDDTPEIYNVIRMSNGNFIGRGTYLTVANLEGMDEMVRENQITKRDEDFNLIWRTGFGGATSRFNFVRDISETPDGGWVATGQFTRHTMTNPNTGEVLFNGYSAGFLAKAAANGDSLWMRVDTLYSPQEHFALNYLSGVVALPSGSIIACGYINRYTPQPAKSIGWIIKVDEHGCIEHGCNPILSNVNLTSLIDDFSIFPNPTRGEAFIKGDGLFGYELYDINGRLLLKKNQIYNEATLNLRAFIAGTYFVRIIQKNGSLVKKIIIG